MFPLFQNILWAKNFPDISKRKKDVKGVCFKYQGYFDVMEIKKYQLKQADDGIWWVQFSTWRTTCLPFKWPLRGKLRNRSIFFLIMTGCIAVLGMYNSQVSYIFNRPPSQHRFCQFVTRYLPGLTVATNQFTASFLLPDHYHIITIIENLQRFSLSYSCKISTTTNTLLNLNMYLSVILWKFSDRESHLVASW